MTSRSALVGPARLPLGAHPDASGTTFVVWTTTAREVAVRLYAPHAPHAPHAVNARNARTVPLDPGGDGRFEKHIPGVPAGTLYTFVLDGDETPDPYARFMPTGVHGPARVTPHVRTEGLSAPPSPAGIFAPGWSIYELHVGTFSPEGTYRGAQALLASVAELGFTAIEILPVAAFPGERGWGYDGVALYAPYAPYGEPDDLRALVTHAHELGLAVVIDVVYNHFGPAGNYLWKYSPSYFTKEVETPWGPAPDFAQTPMRSLVVENARYWLEEFGADGLRLDATHAIHDTSKEHVLHEITELAHAMTPPRRVFFEDERNDPMVVRDLGGDGVWADDFHHQVHVLLTGERDGYYEAYDPTVASLSKAINQGFTYIGQPFAPWKGKPRGKSPRELGVPPQSLVYCIQNHDQIGNRALGNRLSQQVAIDAYCAASILLLFLPMTPLVFMGQEWAATSPFLFFSDHEGELGEAVRKGRREEFKTFAAFADPAVRDEIPDPQARSTFEASKLVWDERKSEPHTRVLATYRTMLALRRTDPVLRAACRWEDFEAIAHGDVLEVVRRNGTDTRRLLVSFSDREETIDRREGRVVFASGVFHDERLAPRGAVILAS